MSDIKTVLTDERVDQICKDVYGYVARDPEMRRRCARAIERAVLAAATPGQEAVPYTSAIGDAGEQYLNQFSTRHPLPATFRWYELWEAMQHAALKSASVSEQKGDV